MLSLLLSSWCWWMFLLGLLGASLLGGWIGWLLKHAKSLIWREKAVKVETQYTSLKSDYDGYLTKYNTLNTNYGVADKERISLKREVGDWRLKWENQSAELTEWKNKYQGVNTTYLGFKSDSDKRDADWKLKWENSQ